MKNKCIRLSSVEAKTQMTIRLNEIVRYNTIGRLQSTYHGEKLVMIQTNGEV